MTKNDKPFEITSVCKEDLKEEFEDNEEALKTIDEMNDEDMKKLASKMANLYCGCCFWQSLETIFTDRFLNK